MTTPWLTVAKYVAIPLLVLAGWGWGDYHGQEVGDEKCNVERLANAGAANAELARQVKKADDYAKQLAEADAIIDGLTKRLNAAAAAPIRRVVCHAAAGGSGTVPGGAGKAGGETTGSDVTGNVRGSDFDPSTDLRKLHYAFAVSYAACIDELNRWPN